MHELIAHPNNYQKANRKAKDIRYLIIHYTGNLGDTAAGNANFFFTPVSPVRSAHYFVDEAEIWRSVQDKDIAWQVSANRYYCDAHNNNAIGIEICMLDHAKGVRKKSIEHAAKLAKILMEKYEIPVSRVVRHYDVTHKCCPAPMVQDAALWQMFLGLLTKGEIDMTHDEVVQIIGEIKPVYKKPEDVPDWGRDTVEKLIKKKLLGDNGSDLNLSEDSLRVLVINDRAKLYRWKVF